MVGSGIEGGGVVASPPQQPGDVDAVCRLVLVELDVVNAASEQGDRVPPRAAWVAPTATWARPFHGARDASGSVFQHFVGVERHAVVEQSLGFEQGLVG